MKNGKRKNRRRKTERRKTEDEKRKAKKQKTKTENTKNRVIPENPDISGSKDPDRDHAPFRAQRYSNTAMMTVTIRTVHRMRPMSGAAYL